MQLHLSDTLMAKYPMYSKNEVRSVLKPILNYKSAKLKTAHIVNFTIPHLGRCKSHGNKKKNKYLLLDKKKKRKKYLEKSMSKEKLLF